MAETQNSEIPADIIRQLHRAQLEELADPLIYYLRNDSSEEVREEAAETLGDFLDFPRVREALTQARNDDPAARVRRQAERTLEAKGLRDGGRRHLLGRSPSEYT